MSSAVCTRPARSSATHCAPRRSGLGRPNLRPDLRPRFGSPTPVWCLDVSGAAVGDPADDWRAFATLADGIRDAAVDARDDGLATWLAPARAGEAPDDLHPIAARAPELPRSLDAWFAAATGGRQPPTSFPVEAPDAAGLFALRRAAEGAIVIAVDAGAGEGLLLPLRRASSRRLSVDAAAISKNACSGCCRKVRFSRSVAAGRSKST